MKIQTAKSSSLVCQHALEDHFKIHKKVNRWRCLLTELHFMGSHFVQVLLNPRHGFFEKIQILTIGFRRYLAYLLPRMR
jgi:hypothetical protein